MAYLAPKSRHVTLVYTDFPTVTESAAGVGAFNFYRLNSAYDVNTSLGSTATPGFAEWSAFFGNYRVWKTRVRVESAVSGITGSGLATVMLIVNPSQPTLPASSTNWPVQYGTVHETVSNVTNGGRQITVLDKQYSLPAVFRVTSRQFRDDFDFTAITSSNPTRQGYVAFAVKSNGSSTAVSAFAQVYVSMDIEFFNPILLAS
jgi:hypothetical protein